MFRSMFGGNNGQQQPAAAAGPPAEPDRDWSGGGRLKDTVSRWPLATLLLVITNFACYAYELSDDSTVYNYGIAVQPVLWYPHQWYRVITNAYLHNGAFHILLNMYAFFTLGSSVERSLGSLVLLGLNALFTVVVGLLYVAFMYIYYEISKKDTALYSLAVGYSGVIFAVLVVETGLTMQAGVTHSRLGPFNLPTWARPLAFLVLIQLFMPNISWAGHLGGVVAGALYVKGMLLPFSLPRGVVRWFERRLLPARWLTERQCWHKVPEQDPLEEMHFGFVRAMAAAACCGGGMDCAGACARCCHRYFGLGNYQMEGHRGGQASGVAAQAAAARPGRPAPGGAREAAAAAAAARVAAANAAAQQGGGGAEGAAAGNADIGRGRPASPSRLNASPPQSQSHQFPSGTGRAFPSMPPSALMEASRPDSPSAHRQSQQRSESVGDYSSGGGGAAHPGGGGYSRLVPSHDDEEVEQRPRLSSSPGGVMPPARSVLDMPMDAPLLHPSEDPDLELARSASAAQRPQEL